MFETGQVVLCDVPGFEGWLAVIFVAGAFLALWRVIGAGSGSLAVAARNVAVLAAAKGPRLAGAT